MSKSSKELVLTGGIGGVSSLILWTVLSQWSIQRWVLLASLSLGAFIVGCLLGFLLSSYGEEELATIGKIRDWLIGGLTALTVVKAAQLKDVLFYFAFNGTAGEPTRGEIGLVIGVSIFYTGMGFFFMYFERELFLNLNLARSRAERGKIEGSQQAAQVVRTLLLRLPASLLTGAQYVDEIDNLHKEEADLLQKQLYSDDVNGFLKEVQEAADAGKLDWDLVSKTAYVYYYRTYFEKENPEEALNRAVEWITRALTINPLHVELTMKYAEMVGNRHEYEAVVAILERLATRAEAPILVLEWLGYYLRFMPGREDDSIEYSKKYLQSFPSDTNPLFNLAYAYGRKYCNELRAAGVPELLNSQSRRDALSNLRKAFLDQPKMMERVKKWTVEGGGVECLQNDKEFRLLVGLDKAATGDTKPIEEKDMSPTA